MDHDLTTEAIEAHDRQRMLPPDVQQNLVDQLVAHFQEHLPCLDAGAGTGMLAIPLARADIQVTALDASPRMLKVFRARLGSDDATPLVLGDIQNMPFPDAAFGSALVTNVFHLVPDWIQALTELRRVLRPDRRLLVNLGGGGTLSNELAWTERTFHDLIDQELPSSDQERPTRDAQSFDDLAHRLGFRTCRPLVVVYTETLTPESIISRLEHNVFARRSEAPDANIRRAAAQTRDLVRQKLGTLDRVYNREQRLVYRSYM